MKALLVTVGIMFLAQFSFGQNQDMEETPYVTHKNTLGLNATGLFQQLFNSNENELLDPYLLLYNLDMGVLNFRAGLGPEYRKSTEIHDGFSDSETNTYVRFDGRVGLGFDVYEERRWKIMTGFDVIGGYRLDQTTDDTGFDKITSQDEGWHVGAGPFLQITYFINPRLSISTEAGGYFRYFESTTTELYENFPDFNDELSSTTGSEFNLILPTALFIQFHF